MLTRLRGRAELGVVLLLVIVGMLVLWDALHLAAPYSQSDPVGPRTVPIIVAAVLFGSAGVLARDISKGGRGEAEGGEDVDLNHPADWRTVIPLVAAFIANILLIDWAGWVISGTFLFWGSVWALGSRHYVRDFLVSISLAVLSFYGFYVGLGIYLPTGLLEGIL